MSLLQNTVVTKYLKSQDISNLKEKLDLYKSHFLNPIIQEKLRIALKNSTHKFSFQIYL